MYFQVGQRLEIDFQNLKCLTTLRGWIPDKVLFVDLPRGARRGDLIKKGMTCEVRYVVSGEIRHFQSRVENVIVAELSLIYLRYPGEVHRQRLRSELRVETDFDVWIWNPRGEEGPSTVLDLSRRGCLLETKGMHLSLGDEIIMGGILPNNLLFLDVPCLVRRFQASSRVGVEFAGLAEEQARILELYLGASHRPGSPASRGGTENRGVVGDLQDVPLSVLVQVIACSGRRYELDVWAEPRTGRLYFDRGALIHASVGSMRGAPAFHELLRWLKGQYRISVPEEVPHRNVSEDLGQLLHGSSRMSSLSKVRVDSSSPQRKGP